MASGITHARCGLLLGSLVAWSAGASAAPRVRLDYHADSACPSREAFLERVRARVHDIELSATDDGGERSYSSASGTRGERSERYDVTLEKSGDAFIGRLAVAPATDSSTIRELEDDSCDELASALALVFAIELGNADARARTPPRETPKRTPKRTPPKTSPRARPPEGPRANMYAIAAGTLASGLAPSLSPAGQVGVEVRASRAPPWLGRPAARATGLFASGREIVGADGTGQLTLLSSAVRGCALSFPGLPSSTIIEPCAAVELGAVRTEGSTARGEQASARVWSAAGALAHFVWWSRASFYVDSEVGLLVPATRYRTYLASPEVVLFAMPPVLFRWSLGVAFRFL